MSGVGASAEVDYGAYIAAAALLIKMSIGPSSPSTAYRRDAGAVVLIRNVSRDHDDASAEPAHSFGSLGEAAHEVVVLRNGAGDDRDVGAFGRESVRGCCTDPPASAGNEDPPAGKTLRTHGRTASAVVQM